MANSAVRGFVAVLEKKPLSGRERYSLALHHAKEKRLKKYELAGSREVAEGESLESLVRELSSLASRSRLASRPEAQELVTGAFSSHSEFSCDESKANSSERAKGDTIKTLLR